MDQDNEKIACRVCRKAIPKAPGLQPEGREDVLDFCSTECPDFRTAETEE